MLTINNPVRERFFAKLLGPEAAKNLVGTLYASVNELQEELVSGTKEAMNDAIVAAFMHKNMEEYQRRYEDDPSAAERWAADGIKQAQARAATLLGFASYLPVTDSKNIHITLPTCLAGTPLIRIVKGKMKNEDVFTDKRLPKYTVAGLVEHIVTRVVGLSNKDIDELNVLSKEQYSKLRGSRWRSCSQIISSRLEALRLAHAWDFVSLDVEFYKNIDKGYDMYAQLGMPATCMNKPGFNLNYFYQSVGAVMASFKFGDEKVARAIAWPVDYMGQKGFIIDRVYFRTPKGIEQSTLHKRVFDTLREGTIGESKIFAYRYSAHGRDAHSSWSMEVSNILTGNKEKHLNNLRNIATSVDLLAREPYVDTFCYLVIPNKFSGLNLNVPAVMSNRLYGEPGLKTRAAALAVVQSTDNRMMLPRLSNVNRDDDFNYTTSKEFAEKVLGDAGRDIPVIDRDVKTVD